MAKSESYGLLPGNFWQAIAGNDPEVTGIIQNRRMILKRRAPAATGRIAIDSRTKRKREAPNTQRCTCTCFAMIKTTPDQIRYIT